MACHQPERRSDLDAAQPPRQVSRRERVVDSPGKNPCVDGCQCCHQLSSGSRSKVCQGCLKQGADMPGGNIGVPIVPLLSVAGAGGSALPSKECEGDLALVEVSLTFELRYLPVGGCGQPSYDGSLSVPCVPTRQLSPDLAWCPARHVTSRKRIGWRCEWYPYRLVVFYSGSFEGAKRVARRSASRAVRRSSAADWGDVAGCGAVQRTAR